MSGCRLPLCIKTYALGPYGIESLDWDLVEDALVFRYRELQGLKRTCGRPCAYRHVTPSGSLRFLPENLPVLCK